MPDEPSLHDVLRGSLAHHAEQLGDPAADITADITTVWSRVDRRRAHRRGVAVVGSVAILAAGATGIMLVANPTGSSTPLDGTDGSAALSWACTVPLGSDGVYDYFETCTALPYVVTPTTPPSILPSTIAGSMPVSSVPAIGTAPPTTAFSPFVSQAQVYVVAEGDSVYGISDRFGLDPEVLANYNGWSSGISHPIVVGEQVLIPPSDIVTATTVSFLEQQHLVVSGDTLTAIAAQYGVDVVTLANYNAWPDGLEHMIRPDDVVLIPPDGPGAATGTLPAVTLPPVTTAIISVPESSAPIVIVTNPPTCESTLGELAVTVPCGTAPITIDVPADVVVSVVGAGPAVAGTYRCTGPLGKDGASHYYSVCELIAVPTSSVAGPTVSTAPATLAPSVPTSSDASHAVTVPGDVRYTISVGDNPSKVADMFGITVDALVELNPEVSQTFRVGEVLRLPAGSTVVELQEQQYTAVAGDSLVSIADRYGIDLSTLVAYNEWADGIAHPLVVGETVKIPPGADVLGLM